MGSLWRIEPNGAMRPLRGCSHGEASAAEFRVVGRFVGGGAALVDVGPAKAEEEQPADDGESGDGEVAEGERPPRARFLPTGALPRRRFPRTPGRALRTH